MIKNNIDVKDSVEGSYELKERVCNQYLVIGYSCYKRVNRLHNFESCFIALGYFKAFI